MNRQHVIDTLKMRLLCAETHVRYNAAYETFTDGDLAELADAIMAGEEWKPGRWWRVIYADGRVWPDGHDLAGQRQVWCETSVDAEAREALTTCPGGGRLQRYYTSESAEWRDEQ